jgi:DHH family
MHPKISQYITRFQSSNPKPTQSFDKFFTDFDILDHFEKLPFLFDIENFVTRVTLAKLMRQKVCIYADYDTDAVTATGVMYHGLLDMGFDSNLLDFYTPDRFTEGYGMNTEAAAILSTKFDLIISVDCGINSTNEADIINLSQKTKKPCDLIITDHHHLQNEVPDCIAVVNPRLSEHYSAETLPKTNSKTLAVLNKELNPNQKSKLKEYLTRIDKIKKTKDYQNFLSSSVTGVGVAWFCLVWLGYFWEYIGLE